VNARRHAWLLIAPCLLALLLLFVVPQGYMFLASLGRRAAYGGVVYEWALTNYRRALDPLYVSVFARSLALAFVTTLLCLLLAYPVSYWLARHAPERWRSALVVLVILPFWTSFLVRMYAWMFILRTEGALNSALALAGLGPFNMLFTDGAVLVGQLYGELPFMILPLYATLSKLDPRLLEAASDLGASPWRRLVRVTVPLSRAGVVAGCLLVFIPSLGAFIAPDLLGGARTVYVGTVIQNQFVVARDIPFGAALSFLLSLLVLGLLVVFRRPLRASQEL
jgi:spermidine/putrescine transport system permease protein